MAIEIAASFITVVAVGAELAKQLYSFGFSNVGGAGEPRQLLLVSKCTHTCEDRKYIEFGLNIKGLAHNLDRVQQVVQNITDPIETQRSQNSLTSSWNSTDFAEIVGDYHKTLKECEELLLKKKNFSRHNGFVKGVIWNHRIEPEISLLNTRIYYHALKVGKLLSCE